MIFNYFLLVIMTLLGALGSYSFKKAAVSHGMIALISNKFFFLGGFLYFSSALLNIYELKFFNYSFVLPFTAITYVWTMIIASLFLYEKITIKKIIGVFLIIIGVIIISLF